LADSLAQLGNIDAAKAEFNTALRYSNASFRQRQYIQSRLGELM
jgi:predicted RNA polymerase sigma factor